MATKKASQRTSLAERRESAKVLYYGKSGTGKTTNMAALSNLGTVVHIDAESGVKATALRRRGLDPARIQPHTEIEIGALEALFFDLKAELEDDPESIAGVMIDSVTEIQKLLLETIVRDACAKANRRGMDRDPYFVDRADWGTVTEQCRRLIRRYRDLPCHVGFGALQKREVDADGGGVSYSPALTPAFQTDIMGYVDVIIATDVVEWDGREFFIGRTSPVGKWAGKDRFGVLPKTINTPTFDRVIAYLEGDLVQETDPLQIEAREAKAADTPPPTPEVSVDEPEDTAA